MRFLPMAILMALLAAPVAFPQDEVPPPLVVVDDAAVFTGMALSAALYAAEASTIAMERSRNPDMRSIAEQMRDLRQDEASRLNAAAASDALRVPLRMSPRHEGEVQSLRDLDEQMFDAIYLAGQQRAQDEAVTLYQGFAAGGQPGALRDLAEQLLPRILEGQQHLRSIAPSGG